MAEEIYGLTARQVSRLASWLNDLDETNGGIRKPFPLRDPIALGVATETILAGNEGTFNLWSYSKDDTTEIEMSGPIQVVARDFLTTGVTVGKSCHLFWKRSGDEGKWYFIAPPKDPDTIPKNTICFRGKATANWYREDGVGHWVTVNPIVGGVVDTGTTHVVNWWASNFGHPNCVTGNEITYTKDDLGLYWSESLWDSPIGTIVFNQPTAPLYIPQGWSCLADAEGKFILPTCSPGVVGTTGGSATGNFDVNTSEDGTGISVDDHLDHTHLVNAATGGPVYTATETGDDLVSEICTSGVRDAENCGTAAAPGVLGHTVNDPGHWHNVTGSVDTMPPWIAKYCIVRIDNSQNA